MKKVIYADYAATSPLSEAAKVAMAPYFADFYFNPSTKYSAARQPRIAVENARTDIAQCIGAEPSEIYFTSGGTESDNWAIKGTMYVRNDERCVLTTAFEHHAVLNACASVEEMGYPAVYIMPDQDGYIQPEALSKVINGTTKLVSIMMMNNELGSVQPIQELAEIAHNHNALFHTDAVQAVGHIPVDVKALNVDMLSASAHKFGGPKGVGFLYVRNGVKLSSLLSGGGQEKGLRAGTENVPGIVGMAAALMDCCHHLSDSISHLDSLRERLTHALNTASIDYLINGGTHAYPGIISLSIKGYEGEMLLHRLDLMGIEVATGSACDSKDMQISHVLKAINLPAEYASGTIRISLGNKSTAEDIDAICNGIVKICK